MDVNGIFVTIQRFSGLESFLCSDGRVSRWMRRINWVQSHQTKSFYAQARWRLTKTIKMQIPNFVRCWVYIYICHEDSLATWHVFPLENEECLVACWFRQLGLAGSSCTIVCGPMLLQCQNRYWFHRSPCFFGDVGVHIFTLPFGNETMAGKSLKNRALIGKIVHRHLFGTFSPDLGWENGESPNEFVQKWTPKFNGLPMSTVVYHHFPRFSPRLLQPPPAEFLCTRGVLGEAEEKCWNQKRLLELGTVFGYARHAHDASDIICIHTDIHSYVCCQEKESRTLSIAQYQVWTL